MPTSAIERKAPAGTPNSSAAPTESRAATRTERPAEADDAERGSSAAGSAAEPRSSSNAGALAAAVAARRPVLVKQARRMLRDDTRAEDAVQDAMVAALRNLGNFRGEAQLGTWLYRVGANAVLMGMRRDRRAADRTVRASSNLTQEANWLSGTQSTVVPQQVLEKAEQAELIRWAVDQLPDHYRCVVMLCDLDEQPLEEVARSLGLTPGGVRTRRLRAHRMLRSALAGRTEHPDQ